ncbi:MAG: hypothetical protein F4147_09520, partial [Gammaproteobacteria bacterium]|nr:hypothetical protein [Gammaproteobacteria bacterium]
MPITFSDFLTFPFNGGKGIKQNQVEGLDELAARITAGAGEKAAFRLLADVRVAHGTDYVVPDFTVLQGADVDARIVLFQVPRSGGGNDWSWEEHDDIYRFRTATNYGAVTGQVRFWKDAQDRLVLSSPSGTHHVIVYEIYDREALNYAIRRLIPVLPVPLASQQGRIVQIDSNGEWVSTPPAWEADELDTSVQKRLPPAPSGAGVGKVPAVNAQGSGYVLVDANNSAVSLAGLRIESIELSDQILGTANVALAPKANSIAVDHGEGAARILSNINNANFDVAPGLYLVSITGEFWATKVGRMDFDVRDATDNSVVAGPTGISTYNTGGSTQNPVTQTFTLSGYWHLAEADTVNIYLDRHGRDIGISNVKFQLAQLDAESDTDAIESHETLPDAADVRDDKIYLVDGRLWQKATGQTENTFEGRLDHYSYGGQSYTWDGTSGALGRTGTHGQFTVNPAGAIAAVVNNRRTGHLEIELRKDAYETAKGSASDANDQIKAVITIGGTSETHALAYIAEYPNGANPPTILFRSNVHSALLQTAALGAAWSMLITETDDSDLYTHTATVQHWVEYRLASVADLHAAINAAHNDLEDRLDAAVSAAYLAAHAAKTARGVLVDDIPAQPAASGQNATPDTIYLPRKARQTFAVPAAGVDHDVPQALSLPWEPGEYIRTSASAANRLKITMDKVTFNNRDYYGAMYRAKDGLGNTVDLVSIPSHTVTDFGKVLHNPLSAFAGFYVEVNPDGHDHVYFVVKSALSKIWGSRFNQIYLDAVIHLPGGTTLQVGTSEHGFNNPAAYQYANDLEWDIFYTQLYGNSEETAFKNIVDNNPTDSDSDIAARTVEISLRYGGTASDSPFHELWIGGRTDDYTWVHPDDLHPGDNIPVISAEAHEIKVLTDAAYNGLSAHNPNTLYITPTRMLLGGTQYNAGT